MATGDLKPRGNHVDQQAATASTSTSAANTANSLTVTGVAGKEVLVHGFECVISTAATGNEVNVEVRDNGTAVWESAIASSAAIGTRTGAMFPHPIRISAGSDMVVYASAAGASCVTINSVIYTVVTTGD